MSSIILVMYIFIGLFILTLASNSQKADAVGQGVKRNIPNNITSDLNTSSATSVKPLVSSNTYAVEANKNSSEATEDSFLRHFEKNGAILRAFYVVVGVTAIVIVYFVVRAVRLRRKRSKSRKYGIIAKSGDVEMTPLEQDDEDDDMTVFEIPSNQHIIRK